MRADSRGLAHDGDVEVRNTPAPRAHAFGGEGQKPIGGGAAPLRIGRREMNPDVPFGKRSEDGIDERVKNDIGIRMAGQTMPV